MDPLGSLINGMAFALGTLVVSTVGGYLIFKHSKKFINNILTQIAEAWTKVKEDGTIDGFSVDAKVKTKNLFKRNKK